MEYVGVTATDSTDCYGSFDFPTSIIIIIISCVLGLVWAVFNFIEVRKINVEDSGSSSSGQLVENVSEEQRKLLVELGDKIANVSFFLFRVLYSS